MRQTMPKCSAESQLHVRLGLTRVVLLMQVGKEKESWMLLEKRFSGLCCLPSHLRVADRMPRIRVKKLRCRMKNAWKD
jgi:hypothetical protein